jgi:SpoVK/Ycf46/Vps4 family AAA+-type ATPase
LKYSQDKEGPSFSTGTSTNDEKNPYILCSASVAVYSLNEHEWYFVAVEKLRDPDWKKDAWESLVKAKSQVDLINRFRVLAGVHLKQKELDNQTIDNFKGKGKGLIVLLHGPPGVGKTMIAETIAEDQKRALYRVNLGRLTGTDNWEPALEIIFRQAHFWNAILLIDEAEVVLAERTQENMKQSAWVAGEWQHLYLRDGFN